MKILINLFALALLLALPINIFSENNKNNTLQTIQRRYQFDKQKIIIKAVHKTDDPMNPVKLIIYEFEIKYVIFKADQVKTVEWHSLTSGYNVFGQKKVPIDWEINDIFVSSLVPQETDYGYEVYNL